MAAPSCQGVYLIQSCNPRGKTIFKVGRSDDIKRRMKEYGPTWEILCCFPHDDSRDLENFIIERFRTELKIYANNEYFETTYSASSIMKFFVDGVRFYTPAGKGSLSKPIILPKPEEEKPKPVPVPPPKPKPRKKVLEPNPPPVPKPKAESPKALKLEGLGVKEKPKLTPLHRIKIHLLNPEWPNMWKYNKKDFARFVDSVISQLKSGTLDRKYVKEQVWGFLDPMSVKKTEMNDICTEIEKISIKTMTLEVVKDLKTDL